MNRILVLNAGSSSLKYALLNAAENTIKAVCATGIVEKIGQKSQIVKHAYSKEEGEMEKLRFDENNIENHKSALEFTLSLLSKHSNPKSIKTVGHRVVHGGLHLTEAQLVNESVIDAIRDAIPLAPLHNPANLLGIETAMEIFPTSVKHVAAFDTSFHSNMPKHAFLYGIPIEYFEKHGIRKFGFHGLSHEFVMNQAASYLRKPADSLNLITCHIGAGSSLCCIKNGVSIDTTMGFTPLEGLIMATRCGDIDAATVFYMMKHLKMSAEEIETMMVKKSGWLGLSGHQDARDMKLASLRGEEQAVIAERTVAHRIRKYLGSYYWNLGGKVDAVVFTAGLGENYAELRELCFKNSEEFGFEIDPAANKHAHLAGGIAEISSSNSKKKILVVPTNEEWNIAEKALRIVNDQ
ncbi:acetate kinase-like isoform X1 [Hydractinia symbiolongicarpus]|uniref:acetate kinase-like isoform X1 n=1 Tax=Hydractinia symbiolongicarpus TaxID=13093 RepID=UPI00254DC2A7|nr:acetate kinase-like isoform X1 [Hydractinia symbiolongicarpus]